MYVLQLKNSFSPNTQDVHSRGFAFEAIHEDSV